MVSRLISVVIACCLVGAPALYAAGALWGLSGAGRTIGVVVPLKGKWEPVGRRILAGVMCASGVFGEPYAQDVRFVVKDYGDNDEAVGPIMDELVRDDSVIAVIGPVGERAMGIACSRASLHGIAVVSFTQVEPARRQGTCCFVNFLTMDMQARALLGAARSLGHARFAVLYPQDQFGKAFTETFARLAPSFGVMVAATRAYTGERPEFLPELKALFALAARSGGADALLIPDTAANAGMVASHLASMNKKVRLFGPTLWDSPELIRAGGRSVEGAVFLSGFYTGGVGSAPWEFAEAFRAYGEKPGIWEATAYDTARIMLDYLKGGGATRQGMKEHLSRLRGYDGASGTTSFFADGSSDKKPSVLTVQSGRVVEIFP